MIQILTAVTANGELIIAAQHPRTYLDKMKSTHIFSCIQCNEQVILKNGMIKTPHFAHTRNASCTQAFSEGESEDHLNGKLHLFELLQKHDRSVQLEAYLPSLLQRPDLYIQSEPYPIAIEFQCSQISVTAIQQRTAGYISKNINPIWILRTPKISDFPFQGIGTMQLSAFRQQFFYTTPNGQIILTYCPQSKYFHYISHPMHIKANNYIVKIKKLSLENQTWPFAIIKKNSWEDFQKYFTLYKHQRYKHLDNLYFFNRKGIQSTFLKICYRWRVPPKQIPFFIGIPTMNASIFSIHAAEWQIQFIDYLQKLALTIPQANYQHCESFLNYRNLATSLSEEHIKAVESYLILLQYCLISSSEVIYESKIDYTMMIRMLYNEFLAN
ncbi:competence protein CoiA [Psychrobacillus sp. OK028]|uniref:competence protein CoiA n=1 Tax=Psychrobacillus sp. OK028 TaxID=1884359 RepID=UPI000881E9CA|nr:competence protein CoiA family protein [Psychrobacillus sp. OK028]SDM46005.1 competence protein CoiA [Psychrobacillus sp. OK028]